MHAQMKTHTHRHTHSQTQTHSQTHTLTDTPTTSHIRGITFQSTPMTIASLLIPSTQLCAMAKPWLMAEVTAGNDGA